MTQDWWMSTQAAAHLREACQMGRIHRWSFKLDAPMHTWTLEVCKDAWDNDEHEIVTYTARHMFTHELLYSMKHEVLETVLLETVFAAVQDLELEFSRRSDLSRP